MYDAIVVAGGSARRLGGVDKPALDVAGSTLLERVIAAAADAARVVLVGPQRKLGAAVTREVIWCREDPPGGGPVAALASAVPHTSADAVLVLAADLPWIAAAVPLLLAALPAHGAALLVDGGGRVNQLAAAWRRAELTGALNAIGEAHGAPMRSLLTHVEHVLVADEAGWGADCDTWADVAAARAYGTLE